MPLIVDGEITVPGDKSISHRSLMFAGIASGRSRIRGILAGADCRSTAEILRQLGVHVSDLTADDVVVDSAGMPQWKTPASPLDCGNSGTTARLLMGLLAGSPFCSTLVGDASLSSRPMRRITDPLTAMGARFNELGEPDRLPIEECGGSLNGISYRSPKASAQIKSAILLAGLSGGVTVDVTEPIQSRDHSERMLRALGSTLTEESTADGWKVSFQPPPIDQIMALDVDVPGDISSAAFLIGLALLADEGELTIRNVGINPTRTGFLDAVQRMGGSVNVENRRESGGEPVGDLIVTPSALRGIELTAEDIPSMVDEVPMLACLAAKAEGETRITGATELRAKESDRIDAMVTNLRAIGVQVEELPDGMVVQGSQDHLEGRIAARHDHRIAMAFGILGALPGSDVEVDSPDIVDVSFPGFWELLDGLSRDRAIR